MGTIRAGLRIPTVTVGRASALFASVLSLAACGSDSESSSAPSAAATVASAASTAATSTATALADDVVISVTAGVDSGEDRIESVPLGVTVTLTVVNPDRDDEFHVHGYELGDGVEVPAGQPEVFTFVADQAGEFEVESHTTDVVLLVLNVG